MIQNLKSYLANEKYRSLVVSIAILLSLVVLLLVFTFFAASVLERNTSMINATNKAANNSQAIIKDLFDAQNSEGEDTKSPHMQTVFTRLSNNIKDTDAIINTLETGGNVQLSSGDSISVPQVSNSHMAQINDVQANWQKLKPLAENYLADASDIMKDPSSSLYLATVQAKSSSIIMNNNLNRLSDQVYQDAQNTANIIRAIQFVGVIAILGYFVVFLSVFMRRLNETDKVAEDARRETSEILETVNTGLFLLDKDLKIGNQYSNELVNIIGSERLAGESLSSVLSNRISQKDLQTTEEFIGQLYNPRVKAKLVDSLNPLHKVMFYDTQGGESRFLDFKFSRVYDGKDITRILVNVNDVSDAVRLEQRLEKERAENDRQIEMLTTILNVKPAIMNDFIISTRARINKMNNILKNPGSSQFELESKLKAFYREMHSLKGESSGLKLHTFTKIASNAEDKLNALQNQDKLAGNDFLTLTVQLDELLNLLNAIDELSARINVNTSPAPVAVAEPDDTAHSDVVEVAQDDDELEGILEVSEPEPAPVMPLRDGISADLAEHLVQFGQEIAERQQKEVMVDVRNMKEAVIPEHLSRITKEICVQLLRNAIVHGILDPQTRFANGKNPQGKVSIAMRNFDSPTENTLMLVVEDDGQGINYDAIRQKLINKGHNPEQVAMLDKRKLLGFLFSSGFSTKDEADEDGGRGVGLDIVKDRIKEYDGKLDVQSEQGKFTRFIIKLPIATAS